MASPAVPLAEQSSPGGNIYKHGIELKVAGSYSALLAYLSELEKESGRLLWGRMELSVEAYPRSILTLKVYTLSLTKDWLAL
jgi:MSHA biogenesis protein MshJ